MSSSLGLEDSCSSTALSMADCLPFLPIAPLRWQDNFLQVLHAELSDLGGLRTAPYLVMFASSNFGGWLGDALVIKRQYTVASARKVVNSIGKYDALAPAFAPLSPALK